MAKKRAAKRPSTKKKTRQLAGAAAKSRDEAILRDREIAQRWRAGQSTGRIASDLGMAAPNVSRALKRIREQIRSETRETMVDAELERIDAQRAVKERALDAYTASQTPQKTEKKIVHPDGSESLMLECRHRPEGDCRFLAEAARADRQIDRIIGADRPQENATNSIVDSTAPGIIEVIVSSPQQVEDLKTLTMINFDDLNIERKPR